MSDSNSTSSNNQQDKRVAVSGGVGISGDGNHLQMTSVTNVTDGGAVRASLDAAIKAQQIAMNSSDKTTAAAFTFAANSQKGAFSSMDKALGAVAKAYEGAKGNAESSAKTASYAIAAAAAVAVGALVFKR